MICRIGRAPGRLDLLGGVADYSGALVLEMPTRQSLEVTAELDDALVVGPAVLPVAEVTRLAGLDYEDVRRGARGLPSVDPLSHRGRRRPGPARDHFTATRPPPDHVRPARVNGRRVQRSIGSGHGGRALGVSGIDPLQLALLCQEAENFVVGAPCGVMDQVAVAVGSVGALLPILCRPASPWPDVALPSNLEIVGWPSGAAHDVSGAPYQRARAAAFMGKRIVEESEKRSWSWVSELPPPLAAQLPEMISGAQFLERWGDTADPITAVQPQVTYPVRAAALFGVEEHLRSGRALAALRRGEPNLLGDLLQASNAGYEAMGLGHAATAATVAAALATSGVYGARASGGGCGGTVVVVCDRGALDHVDDLIR